MKILYDENGNVSHVAYECVDENSLELHRIEVKEAILRAIRHGWKGQSSIAGYSYYLYHCVYTPFIQSMIKDLIETHLIQKDIGEACIESFEKRWTDSSEKRWTDSRKA